MIAETYSELRRRQAEERQELEALLLANGWPAVGMDSEPLTALRNAAEFAGLLPGQERLVFWRRSGRPAIR